ncbi:MAG TPA: hydroxyacid dehydrogenase [Chthonomonadales bacterium]|nr:hydroxyacid dehydrogenase [Chthonomonadales bacterium]
MGRRPAARLGEGGQRLNRILCAIPESTYARIMTPKLEARLRALCDVTFCPRPGELSDTEYGSLWAQADAVLTGWGVRPPTEAQAAAATRLKVVAHSAGTVRMLPRSLIERGVVVTSARAAIARTVAEHALMSTLALLRRMPAFVGDERCRAYYLRGADRPESETLYGKTIGIVGLGCVGRLFLNLIAPFACRVLVFDPALPEEAVRAGGGEPVGLERLLRESKVVSLHAPDIPATRGLIGARELAWMPDGAVLVNTARGRLVDTEALTAEAATGRLLIAIDVTEPEPLPAEHPLRSMPNVLWTPHIAGPTTDDLPHLARTAIDDLERCLRGEPPLYPIGLREYDLMSF